MIKGLKIFIFFCCAVFRCAGLEIKNLDEIGKRLEAQVSYKPVSYKNIRVL